MWLLPAIALVVTLFAWLAAGRYVGTDNAYVKGDRALIATELSGIIVEVPVKENQAVSRGQLLFKLDDQAYRLALARIEADLETTRADIRGLRAQWREPMRARLGIAESSTVTVHRPDLTLQGLRLVFERNVGPKSALKLPRGANNLWNKGGFMYAPPVR